MNRVLWSAVGIFAVLLGNSALAASTDTLLLRGVVSAVNDIDVVEVTGVNDTLDILAGETSTVAHVHETSNNLTGYRITVASPNGGELRNTTDPTKKTTYTLGYNGAAHVSPTVAPLLVKNVASLTGLTTNTSAVAVTVTPYRGAPAGTYEDTLTFTISANR